MKKPNKLWFHSIKEVDIFGESIIFTVNQKTNVKSAIGAFATLILAGLAIFMFFFMGDSFLNRTDSQTSFSTRKDVEPPIVSTINSKRLFFAFKLRTIAATIPEDGTIYNIFANRLTPNQQTTFKKLSLSRCKDNPFLDHVYIRDNNLDDFWCLPINSEFFGGNRFDINYTYYTVSLQFCTPTTLGCRIGTIRSLYDTQASTIYPEIAYPEIFFDPSNKDDPLRIRHPILTDTYSAFSYNYRELFLKNTTMSDDKGWMIQDLKKQHFLSVGEMTNKGYYKASSGSPLISMYNFYMGTTSEQYTRKYQKFQDVIAVVGGFMKIVQVIFKILIVNIAKYTRNLEIMNEIINWKDEEEEVKIPSSYSKKSLTDTKFKRLFQFISNELSNSNNLINRPNNLSLSLSKPEELDISDQTMLKLNERVKDPANRKQKQISKDRVTLRNTLDIELANYKKMDLAEIKNETFKPTNSKKKFQFKLTKCELIKKMICKKCLEKNEIKRVELYKMAEEYMKERLDVIGYLNFMNEMNVIKSILFNSEQISSLRHFENPTIYINNPKLDLTNVRNMKFVLPSKQQGTTEAEMQQIANYFSKKIYDKNLDNSDKIILASLDEKVLKEIAYKNIIALESLKANFIPNFDTDKENESIC